MLEQSIADITHSQDKQITDFIATWHNILEKGLPEAVAENTTLKQQLSEKEENVSSLQDELHKAQAKLKAEASMQEMIQTYKNDIEKLQEKIKVRCHLKYLRKDFKNIFSMMNIWELHHSFLLSKRNNPQCTNQKLSKGSFDAAPYTLQLHQYF